MNNPDYARFFRTGRGADMRETPMPVSELLARVQQGDTTAANELYDIVYGQLRELARRQRRRRNEVTLNTTALVNEAFLKLAGASHMGLRDRAHLLATAATAMRQVLIDHARYRRAGKRSAGLPAVALDEVASFVQADAEFDDTDADMLLALDASLSRLAQRSERQRRVVECRFFAGMTIEQTAHVLDTSPATVKRDWAIALAWLQRDLAERTTGHA
jgi:RNA polymerase sigma factor (TIGR02999 family)